MDSLIFELQIIFYFQLFLSANVRHTCLSATLFQILTFSAFLNISKTAQQNSLSTSSHNLHDIYISMSETFI